MDFMLNLSKVNQSLRCTCTVGPSWRSGKLKFWLSLFLILSSRAAFADEAAGVQPADTAWMLLSTALVLLMTPALGFFYGGMVRSKNALNTIMMSTAALGVVGILWVLLGYSIAFSTDGFFSYAGLHGVDLEAKGKIPHLLFMA